MTTMNNIKFNIHENTECNNGLSIYRWYRLLGTGGAVAGMISGILLRGSTVSFLAPTVRHRHIRQLSTSLNPMPINEILGNSIPRPISRSSFRFSTILSLYSTKSDMMPIGVRAGGGWEGCSPLPWVEQS